MQLSCERVLHHLRLFSIIIVLRIIHPKTFKTERGCPFLIKRKKKESTYNNKKKKRKKEKITCNNPEERKQEKEYQR